MTISEYATKWNKDIDNNFAVACFDQNSVESLQEATIPDGTDMQTWGMSEEEWHDAIAAAIEEKTNDIL